MFTDPQQLLTPGADIITANNHIIKQYITLRFQHEREFDKLKLAVADDLKESRQNLHENIVSSKKIDKCRVMFENSEKAEDCYIKLTEKVEYIYEILLANLPPNGMINNDAIYREEKEMIINYLIEHYKNKESLDNFRAIQKMKLKKLRSIVEDEGINFSFVSFLFNTIKKELKLFRKLRLTSDIIGCDHFKGIMNSMDVLKQEIFLEEINYVQS